MKILPNNDNHINRQTFFAVHGIDEDQVFSAEIVHGGEVATIDTRSPFFLLGTDALVTKEKDITLAVTVADCIPVYFYSPQEKIIGIAHAGWRGILANIIPNTLQEITVLGGSIESLQVVLGPGINECHFEIGEDVLPCFFEYQKFVQQRAEKYFVDLKGIIQEQLIASGVPSENIENDSDCTFENKEQYFSFRRDKTSPVEAMVATLRMNS